MKNLFSLIAKVWIPIAIMILVPLILVNISTAVLMNAIYQDSRNRHLSDIRQANMQLESITSDATKTIQLMANNGTIASLALLTDTESVAAYQQYFHTRDAKNQLLLLDSFGYITSFYFANGDVFFSAYGVCGNGDYFYNSVYQYNTLTIEDLKDFIVQGQEERRLLPYGEYLIDGKCYEGIAYLSRISSLHNTAAVTVITRDQLEQILQNVTRQNGNSALFDQDGNLLYSYREEDTPPPLRDSIYSNHVLEYSSDGMTVMSHYSVLTGLNLVSYNTQAELYQESQQLNRNLWLLNIFCLLSALLVSFLMVRGQMLQMQDTLQLLAIPTKEKKRNLFHQIDQVVGTLVQDKMEMDQQIHQQARVIIEHFWVNLLNGFIRDSEQIVSNAKKVSIPIDFNGFCLLSIVFRQQNDSIEESERSFECCETLYQKMCKDPSLGSMVCKWNHSQIVIVCGMKAPEMAAYREAVCEHISRYRSFWKEETVFIVAGKPFYFLTQASERYAELQNILTNFYEKDGQKLIWEEDVAAWKNPTLTIASELQDRLASGVMTGNFAVVRECLHTIIDKNFANQYFSLISFDLLKSHLKIILAKVYQEDMGFPLEEVLKQLDDIQQDTEVVRYFLQLSERMCSYYQEHIQSETNLKQRVMEYIEANYADPSLTLSTISDHFGFSESYFSKLLKNILEENFSTYLEKIRMEHADKMILHTQLKIEEIAQKVSYHNTASFRRAYKRYIGVSPSERRESVTPRQ